MTHLPFLRDKGGGTGGALRREQWILPPPGPDAAEEAALALDPAGPRRPRLWEISANLHCSIVGTCLTAAELRRFFVKLGTVDARTASDHALHKQGVVTAGLRTAAGKLLHKTLDKRHEAAVRRFARAAGVDEVRRLWQGALDQGDIPGPYWAVLTHPLSDQALVQEAFGDIHMLSHLVGSANRLDLARLCRAERALAERDDTIARQQARLQAAAAERVALMQRVEALERQAAQAVRPLPAPAPPVDDGAALRRKLTEERDRTAALSARLAEAEETLRDAHAATDALDGRCRSLEHELSTLEAALAAGADHAADADGQRTDGQRFHGRRMLYVGGRPGAVDVLRGLVERSGGVLLAHDGGMEDSMALLPGLLSQADLAVFPVDCVSHGAAGRIKKLCREAGKPFVPLRSASVASFLAALPSVSEEA